MLIPVRADLSLLDLTFHPSSQGSEAGGKLRSGDEEEQHQEKKQGEATHTPSSHCRFPGEAGLTWRGVDANVRVRINFWDWYSDFWQDYVCLKICYIRRREKPWASRVFIQRQGRIPYPVYLAGLMEEKFKLSFDYTTSHAYSAYWL